MDLKHNERINCIQCKHFHVTWEPSFPNGCKIYKFKSKYLPSLLVFQSTGSLCSCFEPKSKINPKSNQSSSS